ncbi:hypothetical protein JGU71_29305 [Antrihabitans sp. YC3-6]|uniref:DNA helicase DnaB-like N-terminal domain-containing protein n=1 Tax=Antrihabitans stalagmiti TaxID=2799499 RepID=A0A934NXC3_9NOCA|nr:DnaB-like helicase N-terminal domain-containing protein [Antrihabitans stalagmiti]MBJ8342987.1 hypothetical protein [Antrihabitans stalagmiti]
MASPEAARTVINLLKPADFYRPVCAALLFTVITRLVTESRPHRSALVLAELPRAGKVSGLLSRALTDVALADAREHEISHYARAVLAQSYRRGYATAAVTLAQLAAEASEDELSASCPQWEHKPAFHNVTDMSVSHWFASRNRLNSVVGDEDYGLAGHQHERAIR